jgi:hypothetical protein
MPKEDQASDLYYRIKSEAEGHERNAAECYLTPDIGVDSSFAAVDPATAAAPDEAKIIPS